MASCIVKVLVFLFSVTQVACTVRRSRLAPSRLPSCAFGVPADWFDAALVDAGEGVGAAVPDAAKAAVPAPPTMTAVAPTMAILFHMSAPWFLVVEWSYLNHSAPPGCPANQGTVRIVYGRSDRPVLWTRGVGSGHSVGLQPAEDLSDRPRRHLELRHVT